MSLPLASSLAPTPQTTLDLSHLPATQLYGTAEDQQNPLGWQLSPQPWLLSPAQFEALTALGPMLARFVKAIDTLYKQSQNPNLPIPSWVSGLYDQGKPDGLQQLANLKRLKSQLPLVIRPDLLLRKDGWTLCEIDAVPGGLGFIAALNRFYRQNGFPIVESPEGLPGSFLRMLRSLTPEVENPFIAIVLSDEANDYRMEMAWLVQAIQSGSEQCPAYPHIALIHPREIDLVRDRLVFQNSKTQQEQPIDIIYRFFELFDLPNIPKAELIQYAVKKGLVKCTPPFKPHVEEKLSLALLHHPALSTFWERELGTDTFQKLQQWVPQGWVVDPSPLPPQAVIANLTPGGKAIQDFSQLKTLSQKERELVLKPSGFSPLGWGSRGVTIGHDQSSESWAQQLETAFASFGQTPYILQKFESADVLPAQRLDLETGKTQDFSARVRLCPYYLLENEQVTLAGVLATVCPADKKLIHGMKDAVLVPCQVVK